MNSWVDHVLNENVLKRAAEKRRYVKVIRKGQV